jgi:hypothetical protein
MRQRGIKPKAPVVSSPPWGRVRERTRQKHPFRSITQRQPARHDDGQAVETLAYPACLLGQLKYHRLDRSDRPGSWGPPAPEPSGYRLFPDEELRLDTDVASGPLDDWRFSGDSFDYAVKELWSVIFDVSKYRSGRTITVRAQEGGAPVLVGHGAQAWSGT